MYSANPAPVSPAHCRFPNGTTAGGRRRPSPVVQVCLQHRYFKPLPDSFNAFPSFVRVFGKIGPHNRLRVADMRLTSRRQWLRVVGHRYDLKLWDREPRIPRKVCERRLHQDNLRGGERWISDALAPYSASVLHGIELFLPSKDCSAAPFVLLQGYRAVPREGAAGPGGAAGDAAPGGVAAGPSVETHDIYLKEVVVFPGPPSLVHVYDILEHGRRYYRTLCFTSDAKRCLHHVNPVAMAPQAHAHQPPRLMSVC